MTPLCRKRAHYVLSDYLMLNIGWLVFNIVRFRSLPVDWAGSAVDFMLAAPVMLGQCLLPLLAVGLYALSGYYNEPFVKSRVDDVLNTFGVAAVAALMMFFAVLVNDKIPERLLNYQLLSIMWLLLALPVYAGRYMITACVKRCISSGRLRFATLVVGTGTKAHRVASRIRQIPTAMGFDIVGFVTIGTEAKDGAVSLDEACALVRDGAVSNVIIAVDDNASYRTAKLIDLFIPLGCSVLMVPDLYDMLTMRTRVSSVINEPLVNITSAGVSAATANLKRVGDVVLSVVALVVLSPLFLAIAVAVKADSPGPVFYSQERVGYRRRLFRIHKFRTMRPDAESTGPQLSRSGDPRVTRVGAVLRKYRLDELPQFWNVLVGEMSLVGPRPEREYFLRLIAERAPSVCLLHQVRPGLTSWGMVKFGYACSVDEMIERMAYDLLYIENVSLGVDMRIMLHTINTVFTGKGL